MAASIDFAAMAEDEAAAVLGAVLFQMSVEHGREDDTRRPGTGPWTLAGRLEALGLPSHGRGLARGWRRPCFGG